jgi:rRNA processing protein Krr1/Pno1
MPLYRSKLEDIERQLVQLNQIKLNLQERMASIQQERLETDPAEAEAARQETESD